MAITVKQQEYYVKQEYIMDRAGKKHYIHPMLLEDLAKVTELFSKIDMEYAVLNMPVQTFDDDGDVIIDTTAFDAMNELLELCFNDTYDNIAKWCDIGMIVDCLDVYQGVSGLKKQIAMSRTEIQPSEHSLHPWLKTLASTLPSSES